MSEPHGLDQVNTLTHRIIGGAIEVHRALGPGLYESTYEVCLAAELRHRGLEVRRQVQVPVVYRGVRIAAGYRMDLLVKGTVAVELKAVEAFHKAHLSQLLSYMRLAELRVGLLFNFNVPVLTRGGVKRVVL